MKNHYSKIALSSLLWVGAVGAQDIVINDDCTAALDANESVVFEADGSIVVTTAEPIPADCVDGAIGGGGAVALSVSKTAVESDEPFDIDYAVPDVGYTCTLRRGAVVLQRNAEITRPTGSLDNQTIASDTAYELSCTRNANQGIETSSATAVVDFTGSIGDPPPPDGIACGTLPNGSRQTRATFERNNTINDSGTTYADLFGPFPLGESLQSSTYRVDVNRGEYLSLPFTVPAGVASNANVTMTWEDSPRGSTSTIVSVSECIGGVLESQAVQQTGTKFCHVAGRSAGGSLKIGVDPGLSNCVLQPGRSYYLNVMDYSEFTSSTTCDGPTCWWLVSVRATGAVPDPD